MIDGIKFDNIVKVCCGENKQLAIKYNKNQGIELINFLHNRHYKNPIGLELNIVEVDYINNTDMCLLDFAERKVFELYNKSLSNTLYIDFEQLCYDKEENKQYKGIDILNMCYNGELKEDDEFKHNGYRVVIEKDGYVVKPVVYDGGIKEGCDTTMAVLLDKENTFTKINKLDPKTLKRNDKVQVRDSEDEEWKNVYFMDYELGRDKPFFVSPIPIEDSVDVMEEDEFTKIAIVDCFAEFKYCRLYKED